MSQEEEIKKITDQFGNYLLISEIQSISDKDQLGYKIIQINVAEQKQYEKYDITEIHKDNISHNWIFKISNDQNIEIDIDNLYNQYINSEPNKEIKNIDLGSGLFYISFYHLKQIDGSKNKNT